MEAFPVILDEVLTLASVLLHAPAVVSLANDPARNIFELFTKNFRAMDEAVQVLALRCWRVTAFSILALPRSSVTRRELLVKLFLTGTGRDNPVIALFVTCRAPTIGCASA